MLQHEQYIPVITSARIGYYYVEGHQRTSCLGKDFYVRPHWRRLPKSHLRQYELKAREITVFKPASLIAAWDESPLRPNLKPTTSKERHNHAKMQMHIDYLWLSALIIMIFIAFSLFIGS